MLSTVFLLDRPQPVSPVVSSAIAAERSSATATGAADDQRAPHSAPSAARQEDEAQQAAEAVEHIPQPKLHRAAAAGDADKVCSGPGPIQSPSNYGRIEPSITQMCTCAIRVADPTHCRSYVLHFGVTASWSDRAKWAERKCVVGDPPGALPTVKRTRPCGSKLEGAASLPSRLRQICAGHIPQVTPTLECPPRLPSVPLYCGLAVD